MLTNMDGTTLVRVSKTTAAYLRAASRRYDKTIRELLDEMVMSVVASNGEFKPVAIVSANRVTRRGRRSYLKGRAPATKCT